MIFKKTKKSKKSKISFFDFLFFIKKYFCQNIVIHCEIKELAK